jgi:sugar phosphate isomerase/epimerase
MDSDRFVCSTLTFRVLSLDDALERIRASGVTGIDLVAIPEFCPHADPLGGEVEHARVGDLLARAGLRASSVNALSLTHLNDEESVEREYLRGSLRLAAALGAPVVTAQPGRGVADEEWSEAAARVAEALNGLGAEALSVGVTFTVEAPHIGTLAEGFDRACALVEQLDPSLVGVTLDTSHVLDAGATIGDALERYGARVRHVHLRDYREGDVLVTPGDGEIDFAEVITRLESLGYAGDFSLELEYHDATADGNERELRRALTYLSGLEPVVSRTVAR